MLWKSSPTFSAAPAPKAPKASQLVSSKFSVNVDAFGKKRIPVLIELFAFRVRRWMCPQTVRPLQSPWTVWTISKTFRTHKNLANRILNFLTVFGTFISNVSFQHFLLTFSSNVSFGRSLRIFLLNFSLISFSLLPSPKSYSHIYWKVKFCLLILLDFNPFAWPPASAAATMPDTAIGHRASYSSDHILTIDRLAMLTDNC